MRTEGSHNWSDWEISTLRQLRRKGVPMDDIAAKLNRKTHCVADWLRRYADEYCIPICRRPPIDKAQFEKDWYGPVPYLHWTITKPWKDAA